MGPRRHFASPVCARAAAPRAAILQQLAQSRDPAAPEAVARGKGAAGALHRWLPKDCDQAGQAAGKALAALAADLAVRRAGAGPTQGDWACCGPACGTGAAPCIDQGTNGSLAGRLPTACLVKSQARPRLRPEHPPRPHAYALTHDTARLLLHATQQARAALLKSFEGGPPWPLYASVLAAAPCHDAVRSVSALVAGLVQQARPAAGAGRGQAGGGEGAWEGG